jgi:hypothetical protein
MTFFYIESGAYELLVSEVEKLTAQVKALKSKLSSSADE